MCASVGMKAQNTNVHVIPFTFLRFIASVHLKTETCCALPSESSVCFRGQLTVYRKLQIIMIIMMMGGAEQSQVLSHMQWVVSVQWSERLTARPVVLQRHTWTFVIMIWRLTTHRLTCTSSPPHSCLPSSVTPAQSLHHLYCEYRHQVQFNSVPAGFGLSGVSWIISRCSHTDACGKQCTNCIWEVHTFSKMCRVMNCLRTYRLWSHNRLLQ